MKRIRLSGKCSMQAAKGQQYPTRFDIVAYTGGKLNVDGFDLPVVVDLKGLDASGHIPIPVKHDTSDEMILGETDDSAKGIRNDGRQLCLAGRVTADPAQSPVVKRVLTMGKNGHHWQASIGADLEETTDIPAGETISVNGQSLTGPFVLATRSVLRETSVLGMGADKNTRVLLAQAKGASTMSFEDWLKSMGIDINTLTDDGKQYLMQQYAAQQDGTEDAADGGADDALEATEGDDKPAEDPPADDATTDYKKPPVAAKAKAGKTRKTIQASAKAKPVMLTASAQIQAARKQFVDEMERVEKIEAACGKDRKLVAAAVRDGWSPEKAELEFLKRQARANVPAGNRSEGDGSTMLRALQCGMILRAGGKIDYPGFGTMTGIAMGLPKWLRAGVNADERQQAMEYAHEFSEMSMVDLCRAACRIDGKEPTEKGHRGFIRAAVSGASLADIFTTSINAVLLQKLEEAGDSTQGWTREADANNFLTMDRIRLVKGGRLTKHKRGGTADHATRNDLVESYKISRYSQQFAVDEQDIIDDRFQALKDMPDEMALACARLRPDLVYSIIMANGNLTTTGQALFSATQPGGGDATATQSNLATSAALSATTLQAAMAAMFNFLENGVGLNLYPTHALVPMVLAGPIFNLLQGQNVALAGTAGTVTQMGDVNPLAALQSKFGKIEVVTDQRLTNGVVDPATGTAYSGSSTTWRLVSNKVPTIEVAYLKGSGRAPQVRQYQLDKGQWGIGWDVNLDIGAKALEWRGFYEARA